MGSRGGRAGAVLLLVVLFGCVAWSAGAAEVKKSASVEESIRDCANSERRERGMRTLKQDPALDAAARYHARHMLVQGFFDHKDPSGDGPVDRVKRFAKRRYVIIGENIAAGDFESTAAVCRAWMHRHSHRANILRHSFTRIGGGYAAGGEYGNYYVQVFADVPG